MTDHLKKIACALAQQLANILFHGAFCSDSIRSKQTAKIILDYSEHTLQTELCEDARLREWGLEIYEAMDNKAFIHSIQQALNNPGNIALTKQSISRCRCFRLEVSRLTGKAAYGFHIHIKHEPPKEQQHVPVLWHLPNKSL